MELQYRKFELIDSCIDRLRSIKKDNPSLEKYKNSWKDKDAAERNLQKVIEAMIDIGKMVIADKKLREPGNNREVFLILEENKLFHSEFMPVIDRMIGMRNIIVHSYNRIDDEIVFGVLKKNLKDIKKLSNHLKNIFPRLKQNSPR